MAPIFAVLLLLQSVLSWAAQVPLAANDNSCLSPGISAATSKDSCCASPGTGAEIVDGVVYEYTCSSYADGYENASHSTQNAYECARICSSSDTCHAASWQGGACYISGAGFNRWPDVSKSWVLLVKTDRTTVNPVPDCSEQINEANDNCDARMVEAQAECETKINEARDTHIPEDKVNDIKEQCRQEAEATCSAEKNAIELDLQNKCNDNIQHQVSQCQSNADKKCSGELSLLEQNLHAEFEKITSAARSEKAALETAKNKLEKDLQTCNEKRENLEKQIRDIENEVKEPTKICPRNGSIFKIGDTKWEARCGESNSGDYVQTKGITRAASVQECIGLCASHDSNIAVYNRESYCWCYKSKGEAETYPSRSYDAYITVP